MPEADLIFAAIMLVSIVTVVILLWGKGKAAFESSKRQLQETGYVITHAYERHRGPVTWVWGRYREAVPFYLHFSNRDPIAAAAGRLGIADLSLGQPKFDAAFIARSNKPDWAREFMTKELCEKLEKFESIQFLTSSIGHVLTPDYWPEQQNRELRDVWMLRVDGRLESPAIDPYVELARSLSAALEEFCVGKTFEPKDRNTAMFEGR